MKNGISARQVGVVLFTGLLSPAAVVAGMDWRGGWLAVPVVLAAAWCWRRWKGRMGKFPTLIYIVWMVMFAGAILAEAAGRITAPENRGVEWVVVILWLPALWLAKIKPDAFGRVAEIFYLAMGTVLVFVLVFGATQIKFGRLLGSSSEIWDSFITAVGIGCCGVAAVILRDGDRECERRKWLGWSGASAAALALMSMVTVGVLSSPLVSELDRPFFLMTVGLGQTARVEGLISVIWLLADLTLVGVLLQSGCRLWSNMRLGCKRGMPWVLSAVVAGAALWFVRKNGGGIWIKEALPLCGVILGGVIPVMGCLCAKCRKTKK